MRNFYKRLNIFRSASSSDAHSAALRSSSASIKMDASFIFESESRKNAYDNLNDTLITIGKLRSPLGLSHTDKWDGLIAEEYTSNQNMPPLLPELMKKISKIKARNEARELNRKMWRWIRRLFAWGVAGFLIWVMVEDRPSKSRPSSGSSYSSPPTSRSTASTYQPSAAEEFARTHTAVAFPSNGTVINLTGRDRLAPLEIITSSGSNYLIKLKHVMNKQDAILIYVHGGQTVEVEVPLGTYSMYYAAGQTWYGENHLFGPSTSYSRSDSIFNFEDQGFQVTGYTVTLYTVSGGNMRTREISASEF